MSNEPKGMFSSTRSKTMLGVLIVVVVVIAFFSFDGFQPNEDDASDTRLSR